MMRPMKKTPSTAAATRPPRRKQRNKVDPSVDVYAYGLVLAQLTDVPALGHAASIVSNCCDECRAMRPSSQEVYRDVMNLELQP